MRSRYPKLTLSILILWFSAAAAQPYLFLAIHDTTGEIWEVLRFDHFTGAKQTFLSVTLGDLKVSMDPTNEWLYLEGQDYFLIVSTKDTSVRYQPLLGMRFIQTNGVYHLPNTSLFYISWLEDLGELAIERKAVFDGKTLSIIAPTLNLYMEFGSKCTSAKDNSVFYGLAFDSLKRMFVSTFSVSQNAIVASKPMDDIGPPTELKSYQDGRSGKILVRHALQPGNENKRYFAYDPVSGYVTPDIVYSKRSLGFLSADAEKVILQEVLFTKSAEEAREYKTGSVDVFETNTALLVQHLDLPPEGEVLIFQKYPSRLFYYLAREERFIAVDLVPH